MRPCEGICVFNIHIRTYVTEVSLITLVTVTDVAALNVTAVSVLARLVQTLVDICIKPTIVNTPVT